MKLKYQRWGLSTLLLESQSVLPPPNIYQLLTAVLLSSELPFLAFGLFLLCRTHSETPSCSPALGCNEVW